MQRKWTENGRKQKEVQPGELTHCKYINNYVLYLYVLFYFVNDQIMCFCFKGMICMIFIDDKQC